MFAHANDPSTQILTRSSRQRAASGAWRMSGSVQLLNEQGFRCDGRRPNEVRKITCKLGVFEQADGSAYIEMGNTKVLAAVYGPHDTRLNKPSGKSASHDRAVVNCQYSMATFSTNERKRKPRGDFRSIELKNNLKEIFDSAILTTLYPHSQIDIYLGKRPGVGAGDAAQSERPPWPVNSAPDRAHPA